MKPTPSTLQVQMFKVILTSITRIIFTVCIIFLSYTSYANDADHAGADKECKIRMELYTMEGQLYFVQEVINEEELSLKNIKAGHYKMVIRDGDKVVFNSRITIPDEEKQIAEK